ncbi:hypothetical protein KIN20_033522 [Parelaphostrongylus tenuis]|uniref:G-protein coupled receptors family 1 profile domain-containing protein n=1 Tax=Parelaphostrongylus tenuis TaxID=148309 RepID=A0AAD5R8S0_PARTN|nr:hypothetical protein KIN20_033522 [Parelaphostrongylus tenuis]
MARNLYYLIVDIILVLLQVIVIICNGIIIFVFAREKSLRQNSSRQLLVVLTITDFVHAVSTLPYITYLIVSWDPFYLNLSPYFIKIFFIPVIIQLKINLTLTISIALERTLALYFPVVFRNLSSYPYVKFSLLFGFLLGVVDLALEFSLTSFRETPNCASAGCFFNENFSYYWAFSNMVMGTVLIVFMTPFLMKLRALHQQPHKSGVVQLRENRFKQANRRSVGTLLISLVFVTLPSVGAGLAKAMGFHVFDVVGPFYIVGLVSAGACNSVMYLALNKEMQEATNKLITCKRPSFSMTVTTIKPLSTTRR